MKENDALKLENTMLVEKLQSETLQFQNTKHNEQNLIKESKSWHSRFKVLEEKVQMMLNREN